MMQQLTICSVMQNIPLSAGSRFMTTRSVIAVTAPGLSYETAAAVIDSFDMSTQLGKMSEFVKKVEITKPFLVQKKV